MIQFNLLPDVKLAYVRTQRTKRLVMGTALIATAAAFAIFLLLFLGVHVVQKVRISQLDTGIKERTADLKKNQDLDKVLTIQNQLGSLTGLHDDKVTASRTFSVLQQVTPGGVGITNFTTDFTASTIAISGQTASLDRVNAFVDTLKFATYTLKDDPEGKKAFSEVVLSQFGRSESATTYTVTFKFDPALFGRDANDQLTVPKTVTTGSVIGQPSGILPQSTPTNSNQKLEVTE
ncbi:MAG TPA: PilN domain-containing protein [Candidatus Saccharimonadales bacterium]|nr:PilN domain-containing protein [Candidatus Saccharimonadales bacterium]